MTMNKKHVIIGLLLFAVMFARIGDMADTLKNNTRIESVASVKNKREMPRFNEKLVAKDKKERKNLIAKLKLTKDIIKKADDIADAYKLKKRKYMTFKEALLTLGTIKGDKFTPNKPKKKFKIVIGNDNDENEDIAFHKNEDIGTSLAKSDDTPNVNINPKAGLPENTNKNAKKKYVMTIVPSNIYTAAGHPLLNGGKYTGAGMRPDGKIYDISSYMFTSNVAYTVISRKVDDKVIMKSYLIDFANGKLVPMNYAKINTMRSAYTSGGNFMTDSDKSLTYSIIKTVNGVTSKVQIDLQSSKEYAIQGIKK